MSEVNNLVELHRHLDGSMRSSTLQSLAQEVGLSVPDDIRFHAGMGLQEALRKFGFTLSCLQSLESVHRVAAEICVDAEEEGISHLEVRFAPQLHGPIQDVVEAALALSHIECSDRYFDSVADHPLSKWMDLGVRVTVCTDNTFLSAVTLPEEMRRVQSIPGMSDEKLRRLVVTGQAAVFT